MAKTTLKTAARKTTVSRIAVREIVKGKTVAGSSLSKPQSKPTTSKKK